MSRSRNFFEVQSWIFSRAEVRLETVCDSIEAFKRRKFSTAFSTAMGVIP
ncbi:MAG: hypothetical protein QOJ64_1583 [Acidobacteriota bacterium]|nr:hypothetical protein [Acidobacteriota bacterium]